MQGAIVAHPRVSRHVEMFSHVIIIDEEGERLVVQLCQKWWFHDDGSYSVAMHRCDDPLINDGCHGDDPGRFRYLEERYEQVRKLALGIAGSAVLMFLS